ncbi:pMGF360-7L [Recombinant African swine fever virus]|nr:pMGF360-7L [Recombinant African swine fever virus]CAK8179509.1 p360-7L [African swine fever virus]CAK8179671.1 p360-7L [African swine fever virus]CAK8180018.1 p360-7L [African swine fever virus]CAK8180176.1 p360-7L [African swine fever virus]
MVLSLQTLTKKVLARQYPAECHHHFLKCCGLWWHDGPIVYHQNQKKIWSPIFTDGVTLNAALVKAVKENNYDLIKLFTEWGANIDYSLLAVNTEYTRDLCRELGAKEQLNQQEILHFFNMVKRDLTGSNIILCHEVFSHNSILETVNRTKLRGIIYEQMEALMENTDVLSELLTKYWYGMAVEFNLTKAIHYFYQRYDHLHEWRLMCALFYNNVFDLHELCAKEKVHMDMDKMLKWACRKNYNYLTIYYCCIVLGADLNKAMFHSILFYNLGNMFFCIDLGADAFEEGKTLAYQNDKSFIASILSLNCYSMNDSLSLNEIDPIVIKRMLKNYHSKNMSMAHKYYIKYGFNNMDD